jgi:hypothetical protein
VEKVKSKIDLLEGDEVDILADLIICHGDNDSDLITAFKERYKFKEGGTPMRLPEGFDFIAKGYYYGKVDMLGRAIVPKKESLVKVDSKFTGDEEIYLNKSLYALYLDFVEKFKIDFAVGKFGIDAFLDVFQISQGAEDYGEVEDNYKEATSTHLSEIYLEQVVPDTTNIVDNARDYPMYLNLVLKLFELGKLNKSALYSEYILTGENLFTNSGLVFQIANQVAYDDDAAKFSSYYGHPLYNRIISYLFISGMRYDANAPWRFVMDLNLKPTVEKIGGLSKQQFFERDFDIAEGTFKEMRLFFETIFLSYSKLLEEAPLYYESGQSYECCKSGGVLKCTKTKSYSRQPFYFRDFEEFFEDNFEKLLYQYASILNSMFKRRSDISQLLLDLSNKVKKGLDKESLVRYTFNKIKYC